LWLTNTFFNIARKGRFNKRIMKPAGS